MKRQGYITIQTLIGLCKKLEDPRREGGNKQHELTDILATALLGTVCGCEGWGEIVAYARSKENFLRTFLPLPNGIPSEWTFRRMFARILPDALEDVYRQWVTPYVGSCYAKQIDIDGKTVCGVTKRSDMRLHMVSAWIREDGISLGQIRTAEKSNEITAIPQLIESLDVRGGTITIDAMGCQREIASTIVEKEATYILAVKGNHPTLYTEIEEYFAWAVNDPIEKGRLSVHQETCFDHGRTTKWRVVSTKDTVWFESKADWAGLQSFIMVECSQKDKDKHHVQRRFYISSMDTDAQHFHQCIRGHWSIENQLHWTLDVAFREDQCLIHDGSAPQNLSLLRKMALTLLRTDTSVNASIARKRKLAGWDDSFALRLFSGA